MTFMHKYLVRATYIAFYAFCVVAKAEAPSERAVFLGQHIMYTRTFDGLQADLFDGLRIWNSQGTTWAHIEPQKGRYDFQRFDQHVEGARALRLNMIYTLGQTPQWASSRPYEQGETGLGASAEPSDMDDWARYVRTVAIRYKGKISAYEIMNEPRIPEVFKMVSPGFFSGSVLKLAEMTRIAAAEVRKVDATSQVVCPAMTGGKDGLKRLDAFLKTGAGNYCDVIGFHYYLPNFSIQELRELVEGTHRIKKRYGLAKLPLWNTEIGFFIAEAGYNLKPRDKVGPASKSFQSDEAASLAAKILVVSHNLGVERTYWFAHDTSWMGSTVADKRLNRLNGFGESLLVLRRWLSGRRLRGCVDYVDSMFCDVHERSGKIGSIYWGGGETALAWRKQGYKTIEFLNGSSISLSDFDSSKTYPLSPKDVIFLR